MTCDVAVIGEIYLDHVFSGFTHWPEPGAEIFTDQYTPELGGGAVATACALARLGRSVRLIGAVGDRDFETIRRRLEDFGVSAELIARSSDRTGVTVSISTAQDRSFFTYRGANRELPELLHEHGDLVASAAWARHIHLALPLDLAKGPAILDALRSRGATLSLDVGHQVEWLASPASAAIIRKVDYFLPNEGEAKLLAGDSESYFDLCREMGLTRAVMKLGGDGAAMLANGTVYRAAVSAVSVIDTTGAGDAFDAGLIDGVLAGLDPRECLLRACACGTISTGASGALGALPTRDELERFLEMNHVE